MVSLMASFTKISREDKTTFKISIKTGHFKSIHMYRGINLCSFQS